MTQMIGWAIIHSIWQAGAVAAITAALLFFSKRAPAAVRYRIAVLGLSIMAVLPIVTVRALSPDRFSPAISTSSVHTTDRSIGASAATVSDRGTSEPGTAAALNTSRVSDTPTLRARIERVIPWVVVAWLLGVVLFSARTVSGYLWARRLVSQGTAPVSDQLRGAAARISERMGVRVAVRVFESSRVGVPMVVGWLRPVILMPASMLTGLMPQQIEAILAHELAHVRRNDYLVNLLQTVVETVLFYHPAAWWLSGRIREERENACDELAVAACGGDPVFYSRVLLTVEEARSDVPVLAVAANGGSLSRRVHRLLGVQQAHLDIGPRWYAGVFTIALAMVTGGGLADDRLGIEPVNTFATTQDTAKARPSAVLKSDGSGTMEDRWKWAEAQAKQNRYQRYWIGYLIDGDESGQTWLHYDRSVAVTVGNDMVTMGNFRIDGGFSAARVPGISLRSVVGDHEPYRVAVFMAYDRGKLSRAHLASFAFPMSFESAPLIWLGRASDAESIAQIALIDSEVDNSELRDELSSFIGAHNDARAAVPVLEKWAMDRGRSDNARSEAVEGLQNFSSPHVLSVLARVARTDPNEHVRADAIESIGHLAEPAAVDSLRGFARTLGDEHLQSEAVEALGSISGSRGLTALREIIDDKAMRSNVRIEALEALASVSQASEALTLLRTYAMEPGDAALQEEAIEALASIDIDEGTIRNALVAIAANHANPEMQGRAVEALGSLEGDGSTIDELSRIARTHPQQDVRRQALEALGNYSEDERAAKILVDVALSNDQSIDVRRDAVEAYMSYAKTSDGVAFARRLMAGNAPMDLQTEMLEALESIDNGAGIPLIIEIARNTNDNEIRRRAIEALVDSDDPRAIEALKNVR